MTQAVPIISINDNYLIHGREFQSPAQSLNLIRHFAKSIILIDFILGTAIFP